MPSPAPEVTLVLDDLRRIVRALRRSSSDAERRLGVTGAQLFVLKTLATAPALSLNELAERTRTHQSTVSVVVKRLVEAGHVTRTTSAHDGRRIELGLSRRGRALLKRAPSAAQERLIEGLERLSPQRRSALADGLRQLVTAMQLDDEAPAMFFEDDKATAKGATEVHRHESQQ